jgi:hypothetical protein
MGNDTQPEHSPFLDKREVGLTSPRSIHNLFHGLYESGRRHYQAFSYQSLSCHG